MKTKTIIMAVMLAMATLGFSATLKEKGDFMSKLEGKSWSFNKKESIQFAKGNIIDSSTYGKNRFDVESIDPVNRRITIKERKFQKLTFVITFDENMTDATVVNPTGKKWRIKYIPELSEAK